MVRIRESLAEFILPARPGRSRLRARRRSGGKRRRAAGRCRSTVPVRSALPESRQILRASAQCCSRHARKFCDLPALCNEPEGNGCTDEAADLIVAALESCRRAAKRAAGEGLELLKLEEALLLHEAGRSEDSDQTLRSINRIAVSSPCYERSEYLPGTPERLQRLAEIVGS